MYVRLDMCYKFEIGKKCNEKKIIRVICNKQKTSNKISLSELVNDVQQINIFKGRKEGWHMCIELIYPRKLESVKNLINSNEEALSCVHQKVIWNKRNALPLNLKWQDFEKIWISKFGVKKNFIISADIVGYFKYLFDIDTTHI